MESVKLSPKYQVVIPKQVRKNLGLKPGRRLWVLEYQGRIELIPARPLHEFRGVLPGLDTTVERDEDRV